MHPFLDSDVPIVYAHRGGGAEHPENSLAAFANAISHGFRYLETDARLTSDGVVVAIHDDRLDRVSDGSGLVRDHTAAEVTVCRLRDSDGELSDQHIPTLEEVISSWPQARFNLDAKEPEVVDALGDLIDRHDLLERCCVGAFSDERLRTMRRRFGAALCTALGPKAVGRLRAASCGIPLGRPPGDVAQVPMATPVPIGRWTLPWQVPIVDARFLRLCARLELPVHVWTVNDAATMHALLDRGVGGFMTDRPTVAATVMRARGAWPDA